MLREAHRVHVYHSQREGLSVGQSSSVSERTGRPVGERTGRPVGPIGQELNVANAQIRTLLDRQKERILAECQAAIKKHEFQADYERRSVRKLGEISESQQEELHYAQAEELQRRDQQLLQRLLQQNSELREAHTKAALWKHSICSHFPKGRNCEVFLRTKMTRAPCRRRTGEAAPRTEKSAT